VIDGALIIMKEKLSIDDFQKTELPKLADVVSFSNNLEISIYANTTVVKTPEVVFRGLLTSQNRTIGEEYLLNFQRSEADFGRAIGVGNYGLPMVTEALTRRNLVEDADELLRLPPYEKVNSPIGPVIRSRRSVRRYSGRTLTLEALSTILFHAQGVTAHQEVMDLDETISLGKNNGISLRAAPSGGALYPIDIYVAALRVDGLEFGTYRYVPEHHALRVMKDSGLQFKVSAAAQFGELEVKNASVMFIYVYRMLDNSRKYGDSSLAFALIEVGEIAQNVHLTSTALSLGTCDVGAFRKHSLEKILGLDGLSQHVVHLTVIGS
jgi:SagB-type dehydrogenase family enzyme